MKVTTEGLRGAELRALYDRLEQEQTEVDAELDQLGRDDPVGALRLATLLERFWLDRGRIREGHERTRRALAHALQAPASVRGPALIAAGMLAFRVPDNAGAAKLFEEGLEVARSTEDRRSEARALGGLARCAMREHRTVEAGRFAEDAMSIQRELGDEVGVASALHVIAYVAYVAGDDDRARRLFEESIATERRLGNIRATAGDLTNLGSVETRAGRLERAADLCAESLRVALETKSTYLLPYCVVNIGGVVAARDDDELGARLLGAGNGMFERSGAAIDPGTAIEVERHTRKVRTALGDDRFRSAWETGRALTNDQALALARESIASRRS